MMRRQKKECKNKKIKRKGQRISAESRYGHLMFGLALILRIRKYCIFQQQDAGRIDYVRRLECARQFEGISSTTDYPLQNLDGYIQLLLFAQQPTKYCIRIHSFTSKEVRKKH